jgi:hypothetical protein
VYYKYPKKTHHKTYLPARQPCCSSKH